MKVKLLSCVGLFATLWTVAYQAPPSMGFSRQEYWSGFPFPSPGDLPDPRIDPRSPALQADALPSEPPGKPDRDGFMLKIYILMKKVLIFKWWKNYTSHTALWKCICIMWVKWSCSVVSDSVWPQRRLPTRLPHPWDSPGKNTGVGCHFLLQCMKVKRESEVAQLCLTLNDSMDRSLPGSSAHGIFQARVLE